MHGDLLELVYRSYSKEIYTYLRMLCRNRDTAEDLLQETFLKAILSLPDTHENIRAWLYMVARNLYFNYRKKQSLETDGPEEDLRDERPAPDELVMNRLRDERLYLAIRSLQPIKREALCLQYFSGLKQKEIAAVLGIAPEYVRVLVYRAKRELRSIMEEQGYGLS